jgi:hypothetical protein
MSKKIIWSKYTSPETKFYKKMKKKEGSFLTTSNGILFPENAQDRRFNMYEGDCNFMVSISDFKKISSIQGIEMAYAVTPYKVRVGIAKLFNDKEVLNNVDKRIDPFDGVHEEIVTRYLQLAKQKYEDYLVYEDMHGMIHTSSEDNANKIDELAFVIFRKNNSSSGV